MIKEQESLSFELARKIEDELRELGITIPCLRCQRCGKVTSTYPRIIPATGTEQTYECMCSKPLFKEI